ncbi:putative piggybac transposable element-derived, partial [Operophtera brumata]
MGQQMFYGGDSTDEDLSDDDNIVRLEINRPPVEQMNITDESEPDTEDNVPLSLIPNTKNAKPRWRDGFLEKKETDIEFTGDTSLPDHIMELETPLQFFKYLFTDEMFQHITQETLRYATEKRPEKPMNLTEKEIEQFVGICLMMSIIQLPTTRDYWSTVLGHPKKKGRGASVEKLITIDNTDISVTTWYDTRIVNVSSTYVGSKPMMEVRRYNNKEKDYQSVPCPKAVTTYNRHKTGADLLDALLGYYRIQIRSKKMYHRIFFHMIDMITVNAWLLYRRRNDDVANTWLPLCEFKVAVAEALNMASKPSPCQISSNFLENAIQEKKARGAFAIMPSRDVRLDQLDHLPVLASRQR